MRPRALADAPDGERFDVVMMGSGVGGSTVAVLLATHAGRRVLVVE